MAEHLVTLEPSISTAQTDQMQAERVQLIVPQAIHQTYQPGQRSWLMSLAGFVELLKERAA